MKRRTLLAVALAALIPPAAVAADDCFCLHNTVHEVWYKDCRHVPRAGGAPPVVKCGAGNGSTREAREVAVGSEWQKVESGRMGCAPCEQVLSWETGDPAKTEIRGGE